MGERLQGNPEIRVERAGNQALFRTVSDRRAAAGDRLNARMREKYGFADRFIALTLGDPDRRDVVAIRLDPM